MTSAKGYWFNFHLAVSAAILVPFTVSSQRARFAAAAQRTLNNAPTPQLDALASVVTPHRPRVRATRLPTPYPYMAPDATPAGAALRQSPSFGAVPSPATPGVWMVSHNDVRTHEQLSQRTGPQTSFELVVDVTFVWSYPAKSAFVTGTFSNWETTVPMTQTTNQDGTFWILSKALPPGDYQYKCLFLCLCLSSIVPKAKFFQTVYSRFL